MLHRHWSNSWCVMCGRVQLEEAMSQQLDDHIVMLQSMSFSPYKKPFEDRLAKWDATLNLVGTVLVTSNLGICVQPNSCMQSPHFSQCMCNL
jgi:hypothetical protein